MCEITWKTFSDHLILEYEMPKYNDDPRTSQTLHCAREEAPREQDQLHSPALQDEGGQALVHRRDLPWAHAAPGPGMPARAAVR